VKKTTKKTREKNSGWKKTILEGLEEDQQREPHFNPTEYSTFRTPLADGAGRG